MLDAEEALCMITEEYATAEIELLDHEHHFFKVPLSYQDHRRNKTVYMCRQKVKLGTLLCHIDTDTEVLRYILRGRVGSPRQTTGSLCEHKNPQSDL